MNSSDNSQAKHFRQCCREARIAATAWVIQLVVCSTIVIRYGYVPPDQRPIEPPLIAGVPTWVFWGVFTPWVVQILFAWVFAIWILKDDEPISRVDPPQGDAP